MSPVHRRGVAGAAGLLAASWIGSAGAQTTPGAVEATFDRIARTKTLRISALPGELPYFQKDLATNEWHGAAIAFATDIAKVFDAKLDYVEGTYATSILDLQANKVDLAFALNPTPQRALSIAFTRPYVAQPFGCLARKDFAPKDWSELDKPDIRIVCDLGSLHEVAARRFAPKAQITALKTRDECTLFFQSGRADAYILAAILGLSTVARNRSLGPYHLLGGPAIALPSSMGMRREPDTRFAEVLNAWIEYNRGIQQVRQWLLDGLALTGVTPGDVPSDITF